MIVNTNSLHYRMYKALKTRTGCEVPEKTDLCAYVRYLVLMPLFLLFIFLPIWIWYQILKVVWFATLTVILAFCGGRPTRYGCGSDSFTPYPGLKIGSLELHPWSVALPLVVIASPGLMYLSYGTTASIITASVLAGIAALIGIFLFFSTETGKLAGAYLAAKKQRVCPIVEFADKPTSEI